MSFRISSLEKNINFQQPVPSPPIPSSHKDIDKEKIYSQVDIDLIEENFKKKELKYKNFVKPSEGLLEQYRKNLVPETKFERETILYDENLKKWILKKET